MMNAKTLYSIEVSRDENMPFVLTVFHNSNGPGNLRMTDVKWFRTNLDDVNDVVEDMQKKYSVPADRTLWNV